MADIIRLFNANETNFNHYETVLTDVISCFATQEENGLYSLTMEHPIDERITELKIISAPTPDGDQLFRIVKIQKVITGGKYVYEAYARHISYDLLNNFLLNIRPTDTTADLALKAVLTGTESQHSFTGISDVPGVHTANYVRLNPIQAIMGQTENSILNLWGGYLKRNNFVIEIKSASLDRGFSVEFGKNLVGITETIDESNVVTRLYPTVVISDNVVTALPEKYVDSPLINSYPHPIIKEFRIDLTDDQKELSLSEIYTIMRNECAAQYTSGADKPSVNYVVDFVSLRKTEQYKHLAILETVNISDTAYVFVPMIGVKLSSRIIKYTYDCLLERFNKLELGNFKPKLTNQTTEFRRIIEQAIVSSESEVSARLRAAMDIITGYRGGHVVTLKNELGEPIAHVYMDTDDMVTAQNYIMINSQGIAFGNAGLATPPTLAIAIDGTIAGNSALFNSIKTNLISSDIGSSLNLISNTSITSLVSDVSSLDGRLDFAELKITPGAITSTVKNNLTVGGENLINQSQTLHNRFNLFDGSTWAAGYPLQGVTVPEWGASDAVRFRTTNAGTSNTKAYWNILTYNESMNNKPYTLSVYAKNNRTDQPVTVSSNRFGGIQLQPNEIKRVVISGATSTINHIQLNLSALIPGDYVDVTLWHPQLEEGDLPTSWSPSLNDINSRMDAAELKITPQAITATVESNTTVLATKAEITQTNEAWTAKFESQTIGGTNLLLLSEAEVRNADYLLAEYFTTEDIVSGMEYTFSLTRNALPPGKSFGVWVNAGSTKVGEMVHIGNGIFTLTFTTPTITAGKERSLRVYSLPNGTAGTSAIAKVKLEKGNKRTDYSPSPQELFTGITKIDKDGGHFGRSGETVETNIAYDGVRIKDGSVEVASFTDAGAVIADLQADTITGNVINRIDSSITLNIGNGKTYPSVAQALASLGNKKYISYGAKVTFAITGVLAENVIIAGFCGGGEIEISFDAGSAILGNLGTVGNTCKVRIIGGTVKGTYRSYRDAFLAVETMNFRPETAVSTRGIILNDGSNVYVSNCDFSNCEYAILVQTGARAVFVNNRGNTTGAYAYVYLGGVIYQRGTIPSGPSIGGASGLWYTQGTLTPTASTYSPPATSPKEFKGTFSPTKLETYTPGGVWSSYYGATAAQNRWDSSNPMCEGRITFGSDVFDYINDRDAGNAPTVRIRLRRRNSTHGTSSAVTPTPYNFVPTGFTGATRGGWTGWATIPYDQIGSSGFTFKFYNNTQGNTYAIWDAAEIEVAKIKTV